MGRKRVTELENHPKTSRKSINPEAQDQRMIALAVDLAEKQLLEGTAPPSVIAHYLKLGDPKRKLEIEILEKQKDLLVAKTDMLQSSQRIEALYEEAMDAMRSYRSQNE